MAILKIFDKRYQDFLPYAFYPSVMKLKKLQA